MEIKYARKVVYLLISAEFIITVLIDGDTFEYVHFLREGGRLSGIDWERKKSPSAPLPFLLEIRDPWHMAILPD